MAARNDGLLLFPLTIQEAFELYDKEHPEVYRYLVQLTFQVYRKGWKHYGIAAFWERMRWHFKIEQGDQEFKLNNNYRSRYVRKLLSDYPDLDGFFVLRELKSA